MTSNRRVLIITRGFAPIAGGGAYRPLKFAKYLPEFGWDPIVLCAPPTRRDNTDEMLSSELPASVIIERVGTLQPYSVAQAILCLWTLLWRLRLRFLARGLEPYRVMRWMIPDAYCLWMLTAIPHALRLVHRYRPDVVLTTSPPHSVQLLGLVVSSVMRLPWVADLRDPWSQNLYVEYPSGLHKAVSKAAERVVLQSATELIVVTPAMAKMLADEQLSNVSKKVHIITNGYDSDDFIEIEGTPKDHGPCRRFLLMYVGSLYGLNDARMFLATVDRLVQDRKVHESHLEVQFIGPDGTGAASEYLSKPWFSHIPFLPHREAIRAMFSASALLLLSDPVTTYAISSKLFEYLRTSRPILALVHPQSEEALLLRKMGYHWIASPDNATEIESALLALYQLWKEDSLEVRPQSETLGTFDFQYLTGQLAQVLDLAAARAET